jgi:acyl dehydratase
MSLDWYFEDFEVGHSGSTGGRTITDADILNFAGVSGDFNRAHVDEDLAKAGPYGSRIAHGLLGTAITTGLLTRDAPEIFGSRVQGLAFLGIEWKFRAALLVGDTIHVEWQIADCRVTSAGDSGVVRYTANLVKTDGTICQTGTLAMLVKLRTTTTTQEKVLT